MNAQKHKKWLAEHNMTHEQLMETVLQNPEVKQDEHQPVREDNVEQQANEVGDQGEQEEEESDEVVQESEYVLNKVAEFQRPYEDRGAAELKKPKPSRAKKAKEPKPPKEKKMTREDKEALTKADLLAALAESQKLAREQAAKEREEKKLAKLKAKEEKAKLKEVVEAKVPEPKTQDKQPKEPAPQNAPKQEPAKPQVKVETKVNNIPPQPKPQATAPSSRISNLRNLLH